MPEFRCKTVDANGRTNNELISGPSKLAVSDILRQAGKSVLFVEEAAPAERFMQTQKHTKPLPTRMLVELLRDIELLLDAGFDVAGALNSLLRTGDKSPVQAAISTINKSLSEGHSVSEAFSTVPGLPHYCTAVIATAEANGDLVTAFRSLADALEAEHTRKSQLTDALVYPAFLVIMLFAVIIGFAFFLSPTLSPIFEGSGKPLPPVLSVLNILRSLLSSTEFLLLLLLSSIGLAVSIRNLGWFRLMMFPIKRIPKLGKLVLEPARIRFLQVLSLTAKSKGSIAQSLETASRVTDDKDLAAQFGAIHRSVKNGTSFSAAVRNSKIFDHRIESLIAAGDASNSLARALERSAHLLDMDLKRTIDRYQTALTPVMTLVLGIVVGGFVISILSALLSLNDLAAS